MASYVIHDVAGENFLKKINASENTKAGFLLGNLIVDSSIIFGNVINPQKRKQIRNEHREEIQNEKVSTHFRNKDDAKYNIQLCNLEAFLEKYEQYMYNPTVLGYLFHLYTDNRFFKEVFDDAFISLNEEGEKTVLIEDLAKYIILKNNKIVTPKEFWTEENIYGDYTKMNKLVLDHYKIQFNEALLHRGFKLYRNPGIKEVHYSNIKSVIAATKSFIAESENADATDLKIFDPNKIIEFIDDVSNDFIEKYPQYVKKIIR